MYFVVVVDVFYGCYWVIVLFYGRGVNVCRFGVLLVLVFLVFVIFCCVGFVFFVCVLLFIVVVWRRVFGFEIRFCEVVVVLG